MSTCAYAFDPAGADASTLDGPWSCPHEAHGNRDRCLFHLDPEARAAAGVDPTDVSAAVLERAAAADRERKRFVGATLDRLDLDFADVTAASQHPVDLRHAEVGALTARRADFEEAVRLDHATVGEVDLGHADLEDGLAARGTRFEGPVRARECQFEADADFAGASFADAATFEEADFADDASFAGASFAGAASFRGASFYGTSNRLEDHASFADADFAGPARFEQASFGFATFEGARFADRAAFTEARFDGDADFPATTFAAEADFDEARFGADADFAGVAFDGRAAFRGAEFRGGARTLEDDATFADAAFRGEALFHHAHFRYVTFAGAGFAAPVTCAEAEFVGDADFPGATFAAEADFDEARFDEDVDFAGASFDDAASFRGAEFRGDANHVEDNAAFADARFATDADFTDAHFTSANFEGVDFGGTACFADAAFADRLDFRAASVDDDAYVDFTGARLAAGEITQPADAWVRYDLTEATLGDVDLACPAPRADRELLDYFRFCLTEYDGFDFADHTAYFDRNDWVLHRFEENAADFDYAVAATPEAIEKTYLRAKNAASATGNTRAAGEFRVKRQQFARATHLDIVRDGAESPVVRLRNASRAAENYFLGVTCGHGLRLARIVGVFLFAPVVFGLLYALGGPAFLTGAGQTTLAGLATPDGLHTLFENVYFSYISYTTIGYGGIGPKGWAARTLVGFEAFLSAVLAALVVYALVKRSEM